MKMQTSEWLGQVSTMNWVNRIEIVDPDFIEITEQERELDLLFLLETVDVPEFYENNGSA